MGRFNQRENKLRMILKAPLRFKPMQTTLSIEEKILEKLKALPPEKQQQVLDFVEFLLSRITQNPFKHPNGKPMSALEAAKDVVGSLEGPGNLSTQKKVFKGNKA